MVRTLAIDYGFAGTPTVKRNPVNDRECAGLLDVDEARHNTDGRHERG
jgi:hypothetical protein